MENFLRARIQERLSSLNITAFQAAKEAGLNRYMVFDLLDGKKETIRASALTKLAPILDCDPEYLIGAQATPKKTQQAVYTTSSDEGSPAGMMPIAGICEAGVWRSEAVPMVIQTLPISPDPRFDKSKQAAYLARGEAGFGISDSDVIVVLTGQELREGDLCLARRVRPSGEFEISARRARGASLESLTDASPNIFITDAEVIGRIISTHRVF